MKRNRCTEQKTLEANLNFLFDTLRYGESKEFTEAIGVAPSTVTKWKEGKHLPNDYSCTLIADYFGLPDVRMLKETHLLQEQLL